MKSVSKSILVGVFLILAAAFASAQFTHINPPPCDFSNQFYADNGIASAATNPAVSNPELDTEPDGRFGTFRKTGPPATGSQVNWVADTADCSATDPDRRDFRILATTGGNSDDDNSPFTCQDAANGGGGPNCVNQPGIPETLEFISILAFIHTANAFETTDSRTVGFINGGLDGVQQNPGILLTIAPGNPRGISQQTIVSNFEAYANEDQFGNSLNCPSNAVSPFTSANCTPVPGQFSANPCSLSMIQNLQNPNAHSIPQPCFQVADSFVNGSTISNVATPKLRNNWRFATNRNAMDGSDNNCINLQDQNCKRGLQSDSPFGYFCDDLLGMWIITYFWFTAPPSDPVCGPIFQNIGRFNGFTADGFPVILTADELNNQLEANGCGAEAHEQPVSTPGQTDGGAVWLVCPAIADPRNGAIASDAFLDVVTHSNGTLDTFIQNNFTCLQTTGKFCFESSVE